MADIILLPKDIARFWAKTRPAADTDCVVWTGAVNTGGYGVFQLNRRTVGAHRVAWTIVHSQIPPRGMVLHHCDNPPCVNSEHLFLGDGMMNMRDKMAKGRFSNGRERMTCCRRGHPFAGDNLRIDWHGRRACATCQRLRHKLWHKAHPGKQAEYDARRKKVAR